MLEQGKTYVVMGLLDQDSIAYAIGKAIEKHGGKVIYTVQNERMKRIFLDRSRKMTQEEKDGLTVEFCDITVDEEVKACFERIGPVAGIVHSIAYANPKTCLGDEFHTDAYDDILAGFHISAVSLATVAKHGYPHMNHGGSIVSLSFAAMLAFAYYNWMGVNKAALEAVVRGLARRHGRDNIRVNAISAGPLLTKAAGSIPGFNELGNTWDRISPLKWSAGIDEKESVADTALFLLSPYARKITGQVIYVDGGASIIGGELMQYEKS